MDKSKFIFTNQIILDPWIYLIQSCEYFHQKLISFCKFCVKVRFSPAHLYFEHFC